MPQSVASGIPRLPRFLRPRPAPAQIEDPATIHRAYAHYRPRILLWSTVGYGTFYFVRKNYSMAMPVMEHQLNLSKQSLGLILTLHGVVYGISKFVGGIAADRADARRFMSFALLCSALISACFGLSTSLRLFGFLWMANGLFQGMGYPPCARLLTHWFSPKELATKMSIWNISHSLGGGLIVVLCGFLVDRYHSWRICFFVPAAIALGVSLLLWIFLRDTPESVGLPEVAGSHVPGGDSASEPDAAFRQLLIDHVFSNKYIWLISIANFFVYTIRFAVFDWGPTVLHEAKGVQLHNAGLMVAGFELAGMCGMLATGHLTDRLFAGRGAPLSMACMLLCGLSVYLFWRVPRGSTAASTVLLMCSGFFIYSPQALVGVMAANLATKRAAATAVGLTSIFGYASTVFSGWGIGWVVEHHGWGPAFTCLIFVALAGALLFALALPAQANGYDIEPREQRA